MKYDIVIIGGGLAGSIVACRLQEAGMKCALVSAGLSLHEVDLKPFIENGGEYFKGDKVISGIIKDNTVISVNTENLTGYPLEAKYFVLASGKYFSKGLISNMNTISEPVFGLDVDFNEDRKRWFDQDFFKTQPFLKFGVKSRNGRALIKGKTIKNLFVAGEILSGVDPSDIDSESIISENANRTVQIIKQNAGIQ